MLERLTAAYPSSTPAPKSAAAARRVSVSGAKGGQSEAAAMLGAAVLKASSKVQQLPDRKTNSVENARRVADASPRGSGADGGDIELQNTQ
jgi:hypothetical protein